MNIASYSEGLSALYPLLYSILIVIALGILGIIAWNAYKQLTNKK